MYYYYTTQEIKTFGLGSRIQGMAQWNEPNVGAKVCDHYWPLTTTIALEVKNNHVHITMQRMLNKFIETKFSLRCMVWPLYCLFQPEGPLKVLLRLATLSHAIKVPSGLSGCHNNWRI